MAIKLLIRPPSSLHPGNFFFDPRMKICNCNSLDLFVTCAVLFNNWLKLLAILLELLLQDILKC